MIFCLISLVGLVSLVADLVDLVDLVDLAGLVSLVCFCPTVLPIFFVDLDPFPSCHMGGDCGFMGAFGTVFTGGLDGGVLIVGISGDLVQVGFIGAPGWVVAGGLEGGVNKL